MGKRPPGGPEFQVRRGFKTHQREEGLLGNWQEIQLNNVTFGLQVATSPQEGQDFQVWKKQKITDRPEAKNSFQSRVNG